MSHRESAICADKQLPQSDACFFTELHIYEPGDEDCPSESPSAPQPETPLPKNEDTVDRMKVPGQVVLSTRSLAAQKVGTHQLIPKNLAVASRPRNRHHTTVVTFPVGLEKSSNENHGHGADAPWEDYDSDGEGLRRNRRNKSYRAAVTSLDVEAMAAGRKPPAATLKPVDENRASSPGPARSPGRKVQHTEGGVTLSKTHVLQ